jgi:hypothetical protein
MKKRWTRRRFLETSLKGSIVVGSGVASAAIPAAKAAPPAKASPAVSGFGQAQRELLRATMDQIIPASDSMPAASEVGGVEYLDRLASQTPEIGADVEKALAAVQQVAMKELDKNFTALSPGDRMETLKKLETQQPEVFGSLRDYVYESYYTQPKVWKLIGYEFYPTNAAGPMMKPFDESVLAKVKKMPKLYREAP